MKSINLFVATVLALQTACIKLQPVNINSSDPNQDRLERTESKTEQDTLEAFIVEHPELDAETKKALRDGTTTRAEVLRKVTVPKK